LASVRALVEERAVEAQPRSALGKASRYALKQWVRLESYAEAGHGMVEIDKNWAENAMRPIALRRKNSIHTGSEKAGPKISATLSVLDSTKRIGVNGRAYLLAMLQQLSHLSTRPWLEGPMEDLTLRDGSGRARWAGATGVN